MLPTAITLRNYRSFAEPVRLELRPITLLYGINNSGKSALLRFLPLLSDSVAPNATGPLDLESQATRESSFQDLRWKGLGEDDDHDVGLSLHWEGAPDLTRVDYSLHWEDTWRRLVVRRLSLWNGDRLSLEAEWRPVPEDRSATTLTYALRNADGPMAPGRLELKGLVPTAWPGNLAPILAPAAERLAALHNQVQWLSAARRAPERISLYPTAPRWRLKPDGSDVGAALASSPEILSEVSSWYETHLARRLRILDVPPTDFRLRLQHLEHGRIDVDLGDTGEGTIQVLPVLTAMALGRRQALGGPGILAIEEPESHLHASLQRVLAESLCDLAASDAAPRIVMETHSEQLLLGVQLQIMRGKIRPEDVLVYWVRQLNNGESIAEPVTFDADARLQGAWPPGVFSDDTDVAREIIQLRRERAAS